MTRPARLAWSMFAATLVLLTIQTYYVIASHTPLRSQEFGLNSFPIITLGTALGALLGALVASRHPTNRVGWLFCVGQLGTAIGLVADAFGKAVAVHGFPGPHWLLEPSVVLSYSMGAVWALSVVSATFLIVPDGRLPSRRWRPVAWALPVPFVVSTVVLVAYAASHTLEVNQDQSHVAWYYVFALAASWVVLAVTLAATTTSLVLRLRRSQGVLRQQLRWIAAAATALLIGTVVAISAPDETEHSWAWVLNAPLYLGYVSVPVAAGFAVLRYRLYDIDVVISRAALLAILLAFVTGSDVVAVVTIGGLLGDQVSESFTTSLVVTVVVALAFQPLRLWAVKVADRAAYGRRAAPYEALAELSRRLGESPDPATLLPAVADAAAHAVGATRATAVLHVDTGPDRTATWPAGAAPLSTSSPVEVAVTDRGEQLGSIVVETRAGHALRAHDTQLLLDLADQSAIAFRNASLSAELAGRVEQLRLGTLELVESRRRLITAGDAERRRLERAIARDVVPHLEPLPGALARLADDFQQADVAQLEPLVAGSTAALESLREITRGVFPAQLVRGGLGPALASYLGRPESNGHLTVDPTAAGRRFDARVEAAAYFCVAEAAQSLHTPIEVDVTTPDGQLVVEVRGRQQGALALSHIRDRVEAAGGTVVHETRGDRMLIDVRLPVSEPDGSQDARQRDAVSQAAVSRSGPNADLVT